ncbi:MAG: AIM24 family protein, partial [Clostridia bacterium]
MPEVRIVGSAYPTLELTLAAGEDVVVDPGRIGWYAPSVRLHTGTGPRRHGGLLAAAARRLGGGSFLVTTVRGPGLVALAAAVPGHIVPVTLANGEGLLVHQHALLAYE